MPLISTVSVHSFFSLCVTMFIMWPDPLQTWPPQLAHHSSPAGRFSSILLMNFIRISVTLSPLRVSWTNLTSTAIWTCITRIFKESTPLPWTQHGTLEWWWWAHHLQGSSEDTTEQVGVDECVVVIRQLHKVDQRVVLQDEGEFISGGAPVGHTGGDSQVHLKCILPSTRHALKRMENHTESKLWLKHCNYVLSVKVSKLVNSVHSNRNLPLQSHQLFLGNPGSGRHWSAPESPRSGALRCCNPWKREQKRGKDYWWKC